MWRISVVIDDEELFPVILNTWEAACALVNKFTNTDWNWMLAVRNELPKRIRIQVEVLD